MSVVSSFLYKCQRTRHELYSNIIREIRDTLMIPITLWSILMLRKFLRLIDFMVKATHIINPHSQVQSVLCYPSCTRWNYIERPFPSMSDVTPQAEYRLASEQFLNPITCVQSPYSAVELSETDLPVSIVVRPFDCHALCTGVKSQVTYGC